MSEDVLKNVAKWLDTQGYPLEMTTAAAFKKTGFETQQSVHFNDPETGKPRELDVFARHHDYLGILDLNFVVECKSSPKPWVLFCSEETLRGFNRLFSFAVSNSASRSLLSEHLEVMIDSFPWLAKEGLVGYGVRQAHTETDTAYAATVSVAKAALSVQRARKHVSYIYTFPVIVIDAPLIRCSLLPSGELHLEQVNEGELLFNLPVPDHLQVCIRIVTKGHLSSFVSEANLVCERLRAQFDGPVQKVRDSWRS